MGAEPEYPVPSNRSDGSIKKIPSPHPYPSVENALTMTRTTCRGGTQICLLPPSYNLWHTSPWTTTLPPMQISASLQPPSSSPHRFATPLLSGLIFLPLGLPGTAASIPKLNPPSILGLPGPGAGLPNLAVAPDGPPPPAPAPKTNAGAAGVPAGVVD